MHPTFKALSAFQTKEYNHYEVGNTIALIEATLDGRDYSAWSPLTVSWAGTPYRKRRSILRHVLRAFGRN